MYYEDRFDPTNVDEDAFSLDSQKKKVNKLMAEMNKSDKGYIQITRKVSVDKNNKSYLKSKKIAFYASGSQGCPIRNAITGERYHHHLIGSKHEDLYFKVTLCTGETGPQPPTMFFASPDEFERHMYNSITINSDTKECWATKNYCAIREM